MKQEIKVPSVGESVTSATIGEWQKQTGDYVRQNDVLVVMETDKASMDLIAEHSGKLNILKQNGEDVKIGEVIGEVDTSISAPASAPAPEQTASAPPAPAPASAHKATATPTTAPSPASAPAPEQTAPALTKFPSDKQLINELMKSLTKTGPTPGKSVARDGKSSPLSDTLSPAVRKWVAENHLDPAQIPGTGPGGRITKGDVLLFLQNRQNGLPSALKATSADTGTRANTGTRTGAPGAPSPAPPLPSAPQPEQMPTEEQTRQKMSTIRKRIAERLVESQQSTATLTTFNEVDMSKIISLRTQYKEAFFKKHNIKLGFMGFFIKAVVYALKAFPKVNAFIDGDEIVYNNSCHIGVAVSTDRGLVVPVIRFADKLSLPDLEKSVLFFAEKARDGKITPDDLTGGTFTISNGGVFGSLMSTPILNPPQSGILGMHKIEQRPVAVEGEVKIKPMMYIALSYDHRMVDGKESVGFLLKIKECAEDPIRLIMNM